MKPNFLLLGALSGCLVFAGSTQAISAPKSLVLIDPQITPRILLPPTSTASERFAASELATYLKKMSGKEVPQGTDATGAQGPVIILGDHPGNADLHPEKLGVEESIIDVSPGTVRIAGGKLPPVKLPNGQTDYQDRGTLYGVYEFLDRLGVRWYRPEPWGEYVPTLPTVAVPLGRSVIKPVFKYRWSVAGYRYWKDSTPQQNIMSRLWATRNRLGTMTWGGADLGGSYTIRIQHIYEILLPSKENFDAHPEYYALIDGKRRPDGQLCLGNPEVQKVITQKLLEFSKANPNYEILSLEPEDHEKWCQCELCRAMDDPNQKTGFGPMSIGWELPLGDLAFSNRVAKFGAIVADQFKKENPKVKLLWLAYAAHTEPPSQVKSLPDNVLVMPAAFSSAFSDPDTAYSDYSRDLHDPASKPNQNFLRVLDGWGKMTPLLAHEYWSGIAWVGPMPLIGTMKDRLQNYQKMGMQGLYNEVHPQWGPQGIDLYFSTRLTWDPSLDVNRELDLYCRNYYGPAYKPMLEYHQLLEKAAHSGIPHYSYGVGTHAIFTPEVVRQMGPLLKQAAQLTGTTQPYAQRLEGVWAGYEYTRLVTPYFEELKKGNKLEAAKHWERANKFVLSYKDGDVFDNGVMFGSLQFFGNYNLNIPADVQKQAREAVADEPLAKFGEFGK